MTQYAHKALKDGCLEQSEEYLSYRDYICNSYNEQMMFYMHYHRYQFEQGSEYYLTKIVRKLANIDALNCNSDGEVMKNQVFPDITFTDFYGLYNDPRLLHSETCIRLLEEGLIDRIDGRKSELPYRFEDLDVHQREIDRIRPEDVLGVLRFKRYHGKRITGRMNKRKIHLVGMELRNYKQLVDLKCDTLRIGQRINTML